MTTHTPGGLDPREFRSALGTFTTGVTVVTTCAENGEPVGLTANSFNSVSLDPPMVLWSLARGARSMPVFSAAKYWAVHILSAEQESLSNRFATRGEDKFGGLKLGVGLGGVPLLPDCTARFQCRTAFQYEGGDHIILVGEVMDFDRSERAPLVFHSGRYALATLKLPPSPLRDPELPGSFSEDFLGYLLGRAHFQFYRQLGAVRSDLGISDDQHFVLATLAIREELTQDQLDHAISIFLTSPLEPTLKALRERGFVEEQAQPGGPPRLRLTEAGREGTVRLMAAAKSVEAQVMENFSYADSSVLKTLLRRLVQLTDPGLPDVFDPQRKPPSP